MRNTMVALAVLVLVACQPPTTPTSGQVTVTVNQVNGPNNSGNGAPGTGSDAACAGITGTASVTFFSGNSFGGGHAKAGEILLARVDGLTIPSTCNPTVEVNANGQCTKLGSFHTVQQITLFPSAVGQCTIDVCVNGTKCAPAKSIDVIA